MGAAAPQDPPNNRGKWPSTRRTGSSPQVSTAYMINPSKQPTQTAWGSRRLYLGRWSRVREALDGLHSQDRRISTPQSVSACAYICARGGVCELFHSSENRVFGPVSPVTPNLESVAARNHPPPWLPALRRGTLGPWAHVATPAARTTYSSADDEQTIGRFLRYELRRLPDSKLE